MENKDLIEAAAEATDRQKAMSFRQAVREYPKAIMFSALLSTSIVMEGFDLGLIGSFFAFPQFTNKFGEQQPDGSYQILGLMFAGWMTERLGYRQMMQIALGAMATFIFIPFFAPRIEVLLVGQILCGMPWGVFQGIATAYAADLCPVALRAYLTTYVNLCFVMGQLLSTGVLRATIQRDDEWAFRIPFALQWMWPIPIIIGIFFTPESPCTDEVVQQANATVAMMLHTNAMERKEQQGATYLECFRGVNLRRTEIACVSYAIQMICGSSLMGYSVDFFQQAGLETTDALNLTIGQFGIGFVGTVCSWWLMGFFGRRTLYLLGVSAGLLVLSAATGWATGSLLLVFACLYNISVGPVCFCIISEMPSTRLRAKTVVLARAVYNISGIVCNILTPRMINPTAWQWGPKAGFFYAGVSLICIVWMFFRLPEAKGRTYGELQVLFREKIPARRFATTEAKLFDESLDKFDV
ncbi:hypothetical protein CDV36_014352 [Fusarium kuroshium]|uniref:Major facilitator superfamily (MFS) profile domain-containing protein n=1 Tax=Fusarium kuroshium TaxID=2010991 RepID=A0A3M2RI30_9HYPO|nr:hypothetical protein CDV36_014352 [Fusarium kuroshium]